MTAWVSAAGARGPWPSSWIFKHGTYIVDRGLKVLSAFFYYFSVFFSVGLPMEEAK